MSTPSRSSLRRIGALVIIPMIMLLNAYGTQLGMLRAERKLGGAQRQEGLVEGAGQGGVRAIDVLEA